MPDPQLTDLGAQTVSQVASQFSIPPAILQAVLRQADYGPGDTTAGMSAETLTALGVDPSMQGDPMIIAETAAARLSQQFNAYGDWQRAISAYLTGSPTDASSPTSPIPGLVWSILGSASSNPTFGMDGYQPVNATLFGAGADGFTKILQDVNSAGGVVTEDHITNWHEASQMATGAFGNPAITQGLQAAAKNNAQGYTAGQCAWYAARSLGYIPGNLGNAVDWAHRAAQDGMTVNSTPKVGAAVVYGAAGQYDHTYGHVAVVTGVNADGTFVVSEMNVDGAFVADTRTSSMADVIGFIQPPPGTDMSKAVPGLKQAVAATAKPAPQGQQAQGKQGVTGLPDAPKPQGPAPGEVQKFAELLQGAGIDPNDFAQNFPHMAAARRRLMQLNSDPGDYAQAVADLQAHGLPVTQANLSNYVSNQPHPVYPDITVGAFAAAHSLATLHSIPAVGRTPYPAEVARLAASGANWSQTQGFYGAIADDQRPQQPQLSVVRGSAQSNAQQQQQQGRNPTHGALA